MNGNERKSSKATSAVPETQIPIDWRRVRPYKVSGRRFASRTDGAIAAICPDAAAIWRARVCAPLNWRDWLFNAASSVANFPFDMLVEAIDCVRLWLIPSACYLIEQDPGMELATVTRRCTRIRSLAGPNLAGEYSDGTFIYSKLYQVR